MRSKPEPSSSRTRKASGPLPGLGGAGGQVVAPAQPAGAGQVHDQVQAPVGGHVEELAVPADAGDHVAGERGQRRVERLQDRERGRVGPGDGVSGGVLAQEGGQRLYFRQFRHVLQSATYASRPNLAK